MNMIKGVITGLGCALAAGAVTVLAAPADAAPCASVNAALNTNVPLSCAGGFSSNHRGNSSPKEVRVNLNTGLGDARTYGVNNNGTLTGIGCLAVDKTPGSSPVVSVAGKCDTPPASNLLQRIIASLYNTQ